MNLAESWEAEASQWIRWARRPGHDSYWRYHRDQFLNLLPSPGRLTVDSSGEFQLRVQRGERQWEFTVKQGANSFAFE